MYHSLFSAPLSLHKHSVLEQVSLCPLSCVVSDLFLFHHIMFLILLLDYDVAVALPLQLTLAQQSH